MKQFFTVSLCCSLLMLGTAFADQQPDPNKKKGQQKAVTKQPVQHTPTHNTGVNPNAQLHHTTTTAHTNTHTNTTLHNTGNIHNTGNTHVNTNVNNSVHNKTVNKSVTKNFQVQHQNFHAQPNAHVQSVKFNQHYVIPGAHNWHGHQYAVFQNYHPAWHDHSWYHNHYHDNVVLIGGGWYFWNAGYWFPAWGYDSSAAYYPYDGPIYVGSNPTPPDQVIADVQANLQQQGFYQGEVDGLLGPQTRAALADYQQSQGLEVTAAMDEPTLASLGMS